MKKKLLPLLFFVAVSFVMVFAKRPVMLWNDGQYLIMEADSLTFITKQGGNKMPVISRFYSEFVADFDTLRILGENFNAEDLSVCFYDDNNTPIKANQFEVRHEGKELLVVVPLGVADSRPVTVKTQYGESTSRMLFRDKRNVFLDFDNVLAFGSQGALDSYSYDWANLVISKDERHRYDSLMSVMGKMPAPCDGFYGAITKPTDYFYTPDEYIYFIPYEQGLEKKSLLGPFEYMNLSQLVLKFEVFVPSSVPLGSWFYTVFSAYGSENEEMCEKNYSSNTTCGFYSRDITNVRGFDIDTRICDDMNDDDGTAAAWLNMTTLNYSYNNCSLKESFHTNGRWMTVAIPLTREFFKYNVSAYALPSSDDIVSCGYLSKSDMYNFFIHCDVYGFQYDLSKKLGGIMFVGFDNFRIVPEDMGGVRFTKWDGATKDSEYPY